MKVLLFTFVLLFSLGRFYFYLYLMTSAKEAMVYHL